VADVVHDVRPFDRNRRTTAVVQEDVRSLGGIYRLFDVVFVHGQNNRAEFLDLYDVDAERVVDIPLGNLDVSRLVEGTETAESLRDRLGLSTTQPVLLFFGTVSKYKGLEDLIDVFPAVQRATGAVLIVAGFPGKDVDIDAVVERASSLGIADHVSWILEYVPNELIRPLMELADAVALPYRSISDSGVLKVAMSYARPVVATRVGGLPDVVVDGVTGLLVHPGDADALAQACLVLLSDPQRRLAMGAAAEALATQRYGFDGVAATVIAELRDAKR
jgi:glycosyltransferase involved in cell wall biosynthesis